MYERMLNKQEIPTIEEMTMYCGANAERFTCLNEWLTKHAQELIDNKYPCGDGGWINYRVTCEEYLEDAKRLLSEKCR